jgi:hypothetical protein
VGGRQLKANPAATFQSGIIVIVVVTLAPIAATVTSLAPPPRLDVVALEVSLNSSHWSVEGAAYSRALGKNR